MLPAKVITALRSRLRQRVKRLVRSLELGDRMPTGCLAEQAWLVGEAGRALDPEGYATIEVVRQDRDTRREFRICVWDGECEADATSDDGLCGAHAAEQAREDLETLEQLEQSVISGEDAG